MSIRVSSERIFRFRFCEGFVIVEAFKPVLILSISQGASMTPSKLWSVLAAICLTAISMFAAEIPAGTRITVRIGHELNSGTSTSGETFEGSLAQDVVVNGKTIARSGAPVKGRVTSAKSSGRLHAPGQLSIRLTSVDGHPVTTASKFFQGKSHTKSNVVKIGGGAAAGALIGGLAGGGKGAAIGSVAGAGAGTGVAAATGKQEARVPAESALTFTVSGTAHRN
jgi:hypothetical protein